MSPARYFQSSLRDELVKLRFFIGLTNKEAAEILGVSEPTVGRWWTFARALALPRNTVVVAFVQPSSEFRPRADLLARCFLV